MYYIVALVLIVAFIVWALIRNRALPPVVRVIAVAAFFVAVAWFFADSVTYWNEPPLYKRYVAAVKSDLKNLVTAQETYYADSGTYAPNIGAVVAAGGWNFFPTTDVTVEILVGTDSGHAARAHHEAVPDWTCAVWVGEDGYTALETLPPKLRDKLRQQDDRGYLPEGAVDCERQ